MSGIVSFGVERRRRATSGRTHRIEVTLAHRRADGALVVGHDPSRLMLSAGISLVMAIVATMWWSAHFRGIGPPLLLALLAILLAALFVPPSRLEVDREAGVVRLFAFRFPGFARRAWPIDEIGDVTLMEWAHPAGGGTVESRSEIIVHVAGGETIALQGPRSAKGHIDTARLAAICDALREELAPARPETEQ